MLSAAIVFSANTSPYRERLFHQVRQRFAPLQRFVESRRREHRKCRCTLPKRARYYGQVLYKAYLLAAVALG